jgi:hypothetical protein
MANKISINAKVDRDELIRSLSRVLSDKELFLFVLDLDAEIQDWDFTLDLLTVITKRIYENGAEFTCLDESYHEKSRKVIKMLKVITLAPTEKGKTMED